MGDCLVMKVARDMARGDDPVGVIPTSGAHEAGLTKRELFAAMAMHGILASRDESSGTAIANYAIAIADELLERLSKKDG